MPAQRRNRRLKWNSDRRADCAMVARRGWARKFSSMKRIARAMRAKSRLSTNASRCVFMGACWRTAGAGTTRFLRFVTIGYTAAPCGRLRPQVRVLRPARDRDADAHRYHQQQGEHETDQDPAHAAHHSAPHETPLVTDKLAICLLAAEVAPLSKAGGLADVAAALTRHLHAAGHDARLFTPGYASIDRALVSAQPLAQLQGLSLALGSQHYVFSVLQGHLPG